MSDRVLVAMDDAPQSWAALEYALQEHTADELVALHVLNPIDWVYMADVDGEGITSEQVYSVARENAEELLQRVRETAGDHEPTLVTELLTGRPAREIVRYAEENDIDHVVVGSHGRTGVSRILLGSVAESVVRRSPVPVTVIRNRD